MLKNIAITMAVFNFKKSLQCADSFFITESFEASCDL
jgi:hypothetical protein